MKPTEIKDIESDVAKELNFDLELVQKVNHFYFGTLKKGLQGFLYHYIEIKNLGYLQISKNRVLQHLKKLHVERKGYFPNEDYIKKRKTRLLDYQKGKIPYYMLKNQFLINTLESRLRDIDRYLHKKSFILKNRRIRKEYEQKKLMEIESANNRGNQEQSI